VNAKFFENVLERVKHLIFVLASDILLVGILQGHFNIIPPLRVMSPPWAAEGLY
jgi:hypothetical protein